jgi:DNA-binding XRE family transcriptional regulator
VDLVFRSGNGWSSAVYKLELMLDLDPKLMAMASDLVESFDDLLSGLIDLRIAKGLTQAEVASRMGVTQPAIAALEAHDANPTITTLVRYAHALHAKVTITVSDADV